MNEIMKEGANGMEGKGEKFERKGIDEWVIQFIRCN